MRRGNAACLLLRLRRQPRENPVTAAVPGRREAVLCQVMLRLLPLAASAGGEETRLQSLQLLQPPPSPLEQTLPTLNSGSSEDSETLRDNWRREQAEQYTTLQAMFIEYANESR